MNKKVLLISPLFERHDYPLYLPSENLGIGYIAAYLRNNGIEVDILDANMANIKSEEVINNLTLENYFLIGISCSFEKLLDEAVIIAKSIKKVDPSIHINIGGHYPTFQHQAILTSYSCFDSVARCDGEVIAYNLVKAIQNNISLEKVEGLTFRNIQNDIIVNPKQELLENLDELPWPARDTQELLKNKNHAWATQITTSRGCYGNCLFCDISAFYNKKWRARSVMDVVNEIEYLVKEHNCKTFRFTDDEFIGTTTEGKKRALEFAKEIIKRNLKVNLMISARAEDVDYELFGLLAQAGVNDCLIGIESASDRILKLYNKRVTVEQNIKCFNILKELGIAVNLAFIMFDPRMTFEELKNNFYFLREHSALSIDALRSRFWPLYGTPSISQLEKEELVIGKTINNVEYKFQNQKVKAVFDKIDELCLKCFDIDYLLRQQIMDGISNSNTDFIRSVYNNYWINYFENLLEDQSIEINDTLLEELKQGLKVENENINNIHDCRK